MTLDADLRRRTIRHAMLRPKVLLAASLAELPDEDLAVLIAGDPDQVWQLRLMTWPREDRWAASVQRMAEAIGADPKRLGQLLAQVGVQPGD
jgi:hypothetical protein